MLSTSSKHRVTLIYDERMTLHRNKSERGHAERPGRIASAFQQLQDDGLVDRCHRLEGRLAKRQELLWLHSADYVDKLEASAQMDQNSLNEFQTQFDYIYLCQESYQAALIAAGSSMEIVERILSGESRSGVGIVRPPGHHAECDEAYGFCIFNNTALAAKYALEIHHLQRILIVDWDIHHGNGIQRMFEEDPRVLYVSLHRSDFFPLKVEESDCNVVGKGAGTGYSVNIGWPHGGMGDAEYITAFQQVIMPIAYQYNPQLVLIAAGFDSAAGETAGCNVTPAGFGQLTHMLMSLAQGRVALILEGGYNLNSIAVSLSSCVKALLGDPIPPLHLSTPHPAAVATIQRTIKYQLPYWSVLHHHDLDKKIENNVKEEKEGLILTETEFKFMIEFCMLPESEQLKGKSEMFTTVPRPPCSHFENHFCPCEDQSSLSLKSLCGQCQDGSDNWVCLTCYVIRCGRFAGGHLRDHYYTTGHSLVFSLNQKSVWCFECSDYMECDKVLESLKNRLQD